MFRLKLGLMGLVVAGLVAVMAASAAPAFAEFESEAGKLSGTVEKAAISKGGEFVYESAKPKTAVKCPPKSVTINWSLATQKNLNQTYKINWGTECIIVVGASTFPVTISESELRAESQEKAKTKEKVTGTNLNTTTINVNGGLCIITVPATGNSQLPGTLQESPSLTSFEESVLVNTTGIKATAKNTGVGCSILTSSSTGELKEVAFKLKGQGQR